MDNEVNLCMGCMSFSAGRIPCPVCGFDIKKHFISPLVLPPGTTLYGERYIIGKVTGKPGIFGITYLAWDTYTETKAAIKEYFPSICVSRYPGKSEPVPHSLEDAEFFIFGLEQFKKEAAKLSAFDHPNIARVRNYFEENNTGYSVMNHYEGESFLRYINTQGGKLDWKNACSILLQILDGLKEVHDRNYLHHDIKPHNIVYIRDEKRPVLIGFSAARFAFYQNIFGASETFLSKYAPIENYVTNMKEGPWSDIYSCGATFYRMISGQDPPSAPERMLCDNVVPADRHIEALPDDIAETIIKTMKLDISERPQNIKDVKALLGKYSDKTPQSGINIPVPYTLMNEDTGENQDVYDGEEDISDANINMEDMTDQAKNSVIRKVVYVCLAVFVILCAAGYYILKEDISGFLLPDSNPVFTNHEKIPDPDSFNGPHYMKFIRINKGTFMMGSSSSETEKFEDEAFHRVAITRDFYMQTTEVTQSQWEAVMGSNNSSFRSCGPNCPVESVSWEAAQIFILRLNELSKDIVYRLPTEAEWEYACRAGTSTAVYAGTPEAIGDKNATLLDIISWYGGNSCVEYPASFDCSIWGEKEKKCSYCGPNPVAMKQPNAWGLHDMIGNVSEWCSDWYDVYRTDNMDNPVGPESGSQKIFRGGSWYMDTIFCRSAARSKALPTSRFFFLGFRLAADIRSKE